MQCNICGCSRFTDMPKRPAVRCADCGSLERTRVAALHVTEELKPASGAHILHFAPERGLSLMLREIGGPNYRAVDIDPDRYPGLGVARFDLTEDVFDLPRDRYDLIVHNHVLEHVEANYSAVLLRLARSLSETGTMLFSVPILPGDFTDELILGGPDEKLQPLRPLAPRAPLLRRDAPAHAGHAVPDPRNPRAARPLRREAVDGVQHSAPPLDQFLGGDGFQPAQAGPPLLARRPGAPG